MNVFRTIKQFTSKGGIEGWFATKYYEMAKHITEEYKRIAGKVAEKITKGVILEIGSGPAYLSIELSKLGRFKIVGLDISETMIDIAERNVKNAGINNVSFKLGDAADMPFEDEMFDFVVSNGSLHHWKEPVKVFNEIYRVLRRDRRALITDLRRDASKEEIEKRVRSIKSFIMRWGFKYSVKEAYTKEEIIKLIQETKFKKCEIKENPLGLEIWLKK